MSHQTRYATLIDGAFAIRKLESRLHSFPSAADIESIADAIARSVTSDTASSESSRRTRIGSFA